MCQKMHTFALQVSDAHNKVCGRPPASRASTGGAGVSVPCGKGPSDVHAGAGLDKQALEQRSGSHLGWHMESGGSPSGSRKGFIDKTRVISLSDSGLGKETKRGVRRRGVTCVSHGVLNVNKMLMYDTNLSEECVRGGNADHSEAGRWLKQVGHRWSHDTHSHQEFPNA